MTDRQFVQKHYPNARIVYKHIGLGMNHYRVMSSLVFGDKLLGVGFTSQKAWLSAKYKVQDILKERQAL